MQMVLTVDIAKADAGVYKIRLGGSLDTDTVPQLEHHMEEVWADAKAHVIRLELHGLGFISSMGLGAVARIRKAVEARKGVLVTVGAQPQIARVLNLVKMLPREVIFVNHQEADAYLAAIQKQTLEQQRPAPASC
jgi:anti-anti-sigma factor